MRAIRMAGWILVAALTGTAVAAAGAGASSSDLGSLNPEAPPETAQFSFAIGEWACKTRGLQPDGSIKESGPATWTFYYILDGWAIQDDWVSDLPNGQKFHGTNIRSFNPERGKWDNRWLSQGSLQWKYYSSERVGETMVMTGGEGKDPRGAYTDRNTFFRFTEDSWSWRKDRSYDGGETWVEGVFFIDAQRVK